VCERGLVSSGQDPPQLRDQQPGPRPGAAGRQQRRRPAVSGDVGREPPVEDEQDRGAPIGLSKAQLGGAPVTRARQSIPVLAWVPFTGGAYHRVPAHAGEWTHRAVHLRFRDQLGAWDIWVPAEAVQRSPTGRIIGLPATMRPETLAYPGNRNPRRPGPE
jgi:hypothetical protein